VTTRTTTIRPDAQAALHQSYGRCLIDPGFLVRLHTRITNGHPALARCFTNADLDGQFLLLHHGVRLTLEDAISRRVPPRSPVPAALRKRWAQALMDTVAETDPQFDRRLGTLWARTLGTRHDRSPATLLADETHAA
jgi:hypothetical protein